MPRVTNAEVAERIRRVMKMLALQMDPTDIRKKLSDEFDVNPRTVSRWIERAYAVMEDSGRREAPARRHQMRITLRAILQRAFAAGDWRNALTACDKLCRIDGLYAPERITVRDDRDIDAMTSDEQRRELNSMLAQYATVAGEELSIMTNVSSGNGYKNGNGRANGNGTNGGGLAH